MAFATVESLKMEVLISGDWGVWDITDFVLGGSVKKSLHEPPGQWELKCRPVLSNGVAFNVGIIQIMDFVEIRLGRPNLGERIPILTRGLVAAIQISDSVAQNETGEPQRAIKIIGYDLSYIIIGKTLRSTIPDVAMAASQLAIARNQELLDLGNNENVITTKKLGGNPLAIMSLSEYISNVMSIVLKADIVGFNIVNKINFNIKTDFPKTNTKNSDGNQLDLLGLVAINSIHSFRGNLWSYLQKYVPKPVCEMFVEDTDDSSDFIFRWTPFRTINDWSNIDVPINAKFLKNKDINPTENEFPKRMQFLGSGGAVVSAQENTKWFYNNPKQIIIPINEISSIQIGKNANDIYTYFLTQMQDWSTMGADGGVLPPNLLQIRLTGAGILPGDSLEVRQKKEEASAAAAIQELRKQPRNTSINPWYDLEGIAKYGQKSFVFSAPFFPATWVYDPGDPTITQPQLDSIIGLYDLINLWIAQVTIGIQNLFQGDIVVRGNPHIKIGQELFIDRNRQETVQSYFYNIGNNYDKLEQYYVEHVEHSWQIFPNPQFATRVGVTRGKYIKTTPASSSSNNPFQQASDYQKTSFAKVLNR